MNSVNRTMNPIDPEKTRTTHPPPTNPRDLQGEDSLIRYIEEKDKANIVSLIHALNDTGSFYSAYMPKSLPSIEQEINDALSAKSALVYEVDNAIRGVLVFFLAPSGVIDMSGPYVPNKDRHVGIALIKSLMKTRKGRRINAFFSKQSSFYTSLMETLGFTFNEYEYVLSLKRSSFKAPLSPHSIRNAKESEKAYLAELKTRIFGEIYITNDMLKSPSYFDNTYVFEEAGTIKGLAILKIEGPCASLEIFGLDEHFRGRGLGKRFLKSLLAEAFTNETVQSLRLVVDIKNKKASGLYRNVGFDIQEENMSYVLF